MGDETVGRVHWSFWIIGAVGLIWNVMGGMNFVMQLNADSLASYPESYRPIIECRPAWATAAFAIAVFGGAIACLLLLLKKPAAYWLFIASLFGVIVTMGHIYSVTGFSAFDIWIGVLMQLAVAALLIWYAKHAQTKGWIG